MAKNKENNNEKILIIVQAFANIDEIAASFVLAHIFQNQGKQIFLYLGKSNIGLRIQKFLYFKDLEFFQSVLYSNEMVLNLNLSEKSNVKGVRWKQNKSFVEIHVEVDKAQNLQNPKLKIKKTYQFDKLYFIGDFKLNWIENFTQLDKRIDTSQAQNIYLSENTIKSINIPNQKKTKLFDKNQYKKTSICEIISEYIIKNKLKINQYYIKNLVKGAISKRKQNNIFHKSFDKSLTSLIDKEFSKSAQKILYKECSKNILNPKEYQFFTNIWNTSDQQLNSNLQNQLKNTDLIDLQNLIMLNFHLIPDFLKTSNNQSQKPQFFQQINSLKNSHNNQNKNNYLIKNINNDSEIKDLNQSLIITNNMQFKPKGQYLNWEYRKFSNFLLGKIYWKSEIIIQKNTKMNPQKKFSIKNKKTPINFSVKNKKIPNKNLNPLKTTYKKTKSKNNYVPLAPAKNNL